MIEPEDELQQDDQLSQNDEQASQQDIHSNGFDDTVEDFGEIDETSKAEQAYDASESSYLLDFGDDTDPDED
jgi:hypothetical protein